VAKDKETAIVGGKGLAAGSEPAVTPLPDMAKRIVALERRVKKLEDLTDRPR
jgi:hypothetical protein